MEGKAANARAICKRVLSLLILIAAVVLTLRTAWVVSYTLLDSDASVNMILGEKLAREGGILSSTFRYGTELFVVDVQIIYSLLFRICGDWSLVRFWSSAILLVLMLAAYGLLARQSRMSLNMFCVTGAALLLPFSVPYGRIVLYHNYYICQVTLDFVMIGLYLAVRRRTAEKDRWWKIAMLGGGMCVVGFLAGMAGMRQMMICAAPVIVAAVLCAIGGEKKENNLKKELPSLIWAAALTIAIALGYLVNSHVLSEIYTFDSYESQTLILAEPERREMILEGLLTSVGYENNIELFETQGLLSVASLGAALIALVLAVFTFLRSEDEDARFVSGFYLSSFVIITCVFLFLGNQQFRYELYYLPVIVWMIPALGKADARKTESEPVKGRALLGLKSEKMSGRQMTALAACVLLIANGVFYTAFFRDPAASGGTIAYTGLNVDVTNTVEALQPVADYLQENGYTLCYAPYWDGAVIMELTDGQVKFVSVYATGRRKPLKYHSWMADMSLWNEEFASGQKACLVTDYDNIGPYMEEIQEAVDGLEERASFGGFTIYELTDPGAIARAID